MLSFKFHFSILAMYSKFAAKSKTCTVQVQQENNFIVFFKFSHLVHHQGRVSLYSSNFRYQYRKTESVATHGPVRSWNKFNRRPKTHLVILWQKRVNNILLLDALYSYVMGNCKTDADVTSNPAFVRFFIQKSILSGQNRIICSCLHITDGVNMRFYQKHNHVLHFL